MEFFWRMWGYCTIVFASTRAFQWALVRPLEMKTLSDSLMVPAWPQVERLPRLRTERCAAGSEQVRARSTQGSLFFSTAKTRACSIELMRYLTPRCLRAHQDGRRRLCILQ
jgi:hypothetical protein